MFEIALIRELSFSGFSVPNRRTYKAYSFHSGGDNPRSEKNDRKEIKAKCSRSETISLHGPGYSSSQRHTECKEYHIFLEDVAKTHHAVTCNRKPRRKKAELESRTHATKSAIRYRRCKKSMLHNQCSYNNTEMDANRKTRTFRDDEKSSFSARRTRVTRTCPGRKRSNIRGI